MNKDFRNTLILFSLGILVVVVPTALIMLGVLNAYTAQIFTLAGINAIMALSVNIICGITGQLSLGQAGFMAIGGYATILLCQNAHIPLALAIIFAAIITAFFGFLIGFPTLRLEGDYLAIVTLAFGEIIRVVLVNLKQWTGGPNGIQFNTIMVFNSAVAFAAITGTLVVLVALVQNFIRSSYGRAILAVREDEIAANSSGIGVFRYKMTGFVLASFVAGVGVNKHIFGCDKNYVCIFVQSTKRRGNIKAADIGHSYIKENHVERFRFMRVQKIRARYKLVLKLSNTS